MSKSKQIHVPPEMKPVWDDLEKLAEKCHVRSVAPLVHVCIQACLPCLKKELPKKRTFRLTADAEVVV